MRGISVPVYLQFDHGNSFSFPNAQSQNPLSSRTNKWPYGVASVPDLVSRQKYDVVVEMTVPRSRSNLDAGNWMVGLEMRGPPTTAGGVKSMLGWDEEWDVEDYSQGGVPGAASQKTASNNLKSNAPVLARSKRPTILTYRSYIIEHAYRLLRLPLYLAGWHTESEHIAINMMESVEFERGTTNVPSSVRIELRSKHPLEIYTVSVRFIAKLEGLRWLMYRYWLSSAIIFTCLFWSVEMGVLLFTWGVFTLLFSHSSPPPNQIKQESHTHPKHEDTDPGTPFSDTSRTFPTLPSHQSLQYTSPTPKPERDSTPSLHDIPTREEAEADDEDDDEDDDFLLEVPTAMPSRPERDTAAFTDSGIGTGLENERQREEDRGLSRRRSGRLDGRETDR